MDPGMPMMPDPSGGAVVPSAPPAAPIDPAKLAMIRNLLMQRMMQPGQGMPGPMAPAPPMLGAPAAPRPAPQMFPGYPYANGFGSR